MAVFKEIQLTEFFQIYRESFSYEGAKMLFDYVQEGGQDFFDDGSLDNGFSEYETIEDAIMAFSSYTEEDLGDMDSRRLEALLHRVFDGVVLYERDGGPVIVGE